MLKMMSTSLGVILVYVSCNISNMRCSVSSGDETKKKHGQVRVKRFLITYGDKFCPVLWNFCRFKATIFLLLF